MQPTLIPKFDTKFEAFQTHDFGDGYVTINIDTDVKPTQVTGGQNMDVNGNSPEKRKGHTIFGSISGAVTGILGEIAHEPPGGTFEHLRVYDTVVERYVAGLWTALTSVTMTTNLPVDYAYFPATKKTYIVNGTDQVVKYTSGTSGDQTDASFKKGKYICEYQAHLMVAGVTGQENYVWYTDVSVDTFSATNYVQVPGTVTGLKVINDRLMILTKDKIYVLQNFTFNGSQVAPYQAQGLRFGVGCIAQRTWVLVGPIAYFLGLSSEGIAAVYATDGTNVSNDPISLPIYADFNALSPAQLTNACAGMYGRYYRIAVTPSGGSLNTLEYNYDTVAKRWSPPYTNSQGGISCYLNYTVNGEKILFAGNQSLGNTLQLNRVDYDELTTQSFTTIGAVDNAIDANPAKRASQSFKLTGYEASETVNINSVFLRMKKNAGTTTELTVRIETDSSGVPSGTLVNAQATTTIAAFTTATYSYKEAEFTGLAVSGNTSYHIVVKHTTEGSGNSQYYWSGHATGTYTSGNAANYASSTWTAAAGQDNNFFIAEQGAIDGYIDTAALYLTPIGQKFHLRDLFVDAKASGNYPIQVGVNTGQYSGFEFQDMTVSSNGPIIGSTLVIGESVLGGSLRSEERLRWDSIRGYILKLRFRNRKANQPFKIYGIRTRHEVLPKIK